MISNVKEHKVTQAKTFISTTFSYNVKLDTGLLRYPKNVKIIYKNVRGKSISAISYVPSELEYLLPPSTQVRWTGYQQVNQQHILTAEGANVVMDERYINTFKATEEIILAAKSYEEKVNIREVSQSKNPTEEALKTSANNDNNLGNKVIQSASIKPPIPPKPPRHSLSNPTNGTNVDNDNNLGLTVDKYDTVKQKLVQLGEEVIGITKKHNLITEQHKEIYLEINPDNKESKFSNDVEEIAKEKTSFKDKIYNVIMKITKSLGLVALYYHLERKISTKNKFKEQATQIQTNLKDKKSSRRPMMSKKTQSTQWYL